MTERRIARVVIAGDAVGEYEASVETAAQLARWLDAALHGIFVEDEALLNLTGIPSAPHVGPSGESFAAIDERAVLHQFAAHAARMGAAIEKAARAQKVIWSFDVVRGQPSASIFDIGDQDLLVIEEESRPFTGGARLPSRLMAGALESDKSVLLLRGRKGAIRGMVALVQSPAARAAPLIMRATRLASASKQSLTLFLKTETEDDATILGSVRSVSDELAKRCDIARPNETTVANIATGGRLLVVDADPAINSTEALKALVATTRANILFLR